MTPYAPVPRGPASRELRYGKGSTVRLCSFASEEDAAHDCVQADGSGKTPVTVVRNVDIKVHRFEHQHTL